jgi:hypothetical protein
MTIFVDGITLTRKFQHGSIKTLAGYRAIGYREAGDIDHEGNVVEETEVIGEKLSTAWIRGSHDTKIRLASDGQTLSLKGNVGRFGRSDNLFNLDFDRTIQQANAIAERQGFPKDAFVPGDQNAWTQSQIAAMDLKTGEVPEDPWTGARVWNIHLTQNYATGSAANAKAVIEWADTQSVARVKKARLGLTTVVWGSLSYCQVELYVKADEMLAHCKGPEAKAAMRMSDAYQYALANGIIRLEVKCAKDFLKHKKLTYLGNWSMSKVVELFKEKTDILDRCKVAEAADDEDILALLPSSTRVHAAAWMAGVDVSKHMSRRTFFRHAKVLRAYGIDICQKRNVTVIRPKMREVSLAAVAAPDWYQVQAA